MEQLSVTYIFANFINCTSFPLLIGGSFDVCKMNKITKESISGSENIFDRKEIVQKQQNLRKMYQTYKGTDDIEYYAKIKFRETIYEVGEFIILETLSQSEFYVAKLAKVIRLEIKGRQEVFIEVEWVMKKNDLPDNLLRLYGDYISAAEVFPSNEKIYLFVSSIRCKCTVLCIEQYGQLSNSPELIFYTRSNYNVDNKSIIPNPSTWNSDCFCRKPNNPDLVYVQCSKCDRWFHKDCVQNNIINGQFLCSGCFGPSASKGVHEIMKEKW